MVREQYLRQLDLLKESVISFGKMVELIFCDSIDAFIDLDIKVAKRVLVLAAKMDKYEDGIEVSISDLLALQQPIARDLRLVISALKISAEFKKISELSINIAQVPGKIEGQHVRYLMEIKRMSDIATYMLENSLKAFENQDTELAKATAARDDDIDQLFYVIWVELIKMMAKDTSIISRTTYLLFLIRYIEKIADHCCNICESVVYLTTAERIKLNGIYIETI